MTESTPVRALVLSGGGALTPFLPEFLHNAHLLHIRHPAVENLHLLGIQTEVFRKVRFEKAECGDAFGENNQPVSRRAAIPCMGTLVFQKPEQLLMLWIGLRVE